MNLNERAAKCMGGTLQGWRDDLTGLENHHLFVDGSVINCRNPKHDYNHAQLTEACCEVLEANDEKL